MRSSEWKRTVRPCGDDRWAVHKSLAYIKPSAKDQVLHGVLEETVTGEGFYLWQFRLPLYGPPKEVVILNWSERVGGSVSKRLVADPGTAGLVQEAMEDAAAEADRGEVLLAPPGGVENVAMQEVRAYGLLLLGDVRGALECLGRVAYREKRNVEWQRVMVDRAAANRMLLESGQEDVVLEHIREWRSFTLANLRIEAAE